MSPETLVTLAPVVTFLILAGFFVWVWTLELCTRRLGRAKPDPIAAQPTPESLYEPTPAEPQPLPAAR